ncbi:TSUP family transporter, partial [Rathayibacter sp. AY1D7]|uniref:TSUP family transporter n=1 Tax=Rathayibacter sp. AY1D7 TaxID=2080547 RepID=UPI0035BE1B8F
NYGISPVEMARASITGQPVHLQSPLVPAILLLASAKAKIVNVATNLGALLYFVPGGHVIWLLGLLMGAANVAGAYLGSRMAVARGSRFIRVAFLVVVGALILKVGSDVWTENLAPLLR